MTTASTYALLAAGAYWDVRSWQGVPPTQANTAPIPHSWRALDQYSVSESGAEALPFRSGLSARVYEHLETGEVVLSLAGTEFSASIGMFQDWTHGNLPLAVGLQSSQLLGATALYHEVKDALGTNITLTGHSLGGGLAAIMGVYFDRPAYIFAPAPFGRAVTDSWEGSSLETTRRHLSYCFEHLDPALESYAPNKDYAARVKNVHAWTVHGEVLRDHYLQQPVVSWVQKDDHWLLNGAEVPLGSVNKHSVDLHAALLLVPDFGSQAQVVMPALSTLFSENLYGYGLASDRQNELVKMIRGEVGVRNESDGSVILPPNGMLTHFSNDLAKIGAHVHGLSQAAQRALTAQGLEWYYWQGTDYAGQEFFSQNGTVLEYTTALGAGLPGAQDKALASVGDWVRTLGESPGDILGKLSQDARWHVVVSSDGGLSGATHPRQQQIFIGGNGSNTFIGGDQDDVLIGGAADDYLCGGAGNDLLIGGAGDDTYIIERGTGRDTIVDRDVTPGNSDRVLFGPDIGEEQLWFRRSGPNLEVDIIGTSDQVVIKDWYRGAEHHVEQFTTFAGKHLVDGQVDRLVAAMAAFAPPAAGQTELPETYKPVLAPVIAASWLQS